MLSCFPQAPMSGVLSCLPLLIGVHVPSITAIVTRVLVALATECHRKAAPEASLILSHRAPRLAPDVGHLVPAATSLRTLAMLSDMETVLYWRVWMSAPNCLFPRTSLSNGTSAANCLCAGSRVVTVLGLRQGPRPVQLFLFDAHN